MAAPTPTTHRKNEGNRWFQVFHAVWANTDNYSSQVVVDLSALQNTNSIVLEGMLVGVTTGISASFYFDNGGGTDQLILRMPIAIPTFQLFDFHTAEDGGLTLESAASDATGDIIVTTTSAAAADELMVHAWGTCA